MEWVVTASELQVEERFVFDRALDRAAMDALGEDDQGFGRVCTTCFCFSHELSNLFVAGTEEGDIFKCSTLYSTEYMLCFEGHDMNVYNLDYNKYHTSAFLSCSADWTVKLWHQERPAAVFTFQSSTDYVADICWSPVNSTVFASVTVFGSVSVFTNFLDNGANRDKQA